MSAAHATATAVTAASVATAHRVKKVLQNTPTTAHLLSTITRQASKPPKRHAKHVSHANRVNHASSANLVASVKNVPHVMHRVKKHHKLHPQQRPHVQACHAFKRSHCPWQRCKPWPKAAVWNGSTPIQNASLLCKLPSQPSLSPCTSHASAHPW